MAADVRPTAAVERAQSHRARSGSIGWTRQSSPSPFLKNDEHGTDHHGKTSQIVPFEFFLQIQHREDATHDQGNHFLDSLQLGGVELVMPDAIRRYLETIFHEGNSPARQNHKPQGRIFIFKMTVSGERHEDVGHGENKMVCIGSFLFGD
jgi:hypothetical protein